MPSFGDVIRPQIAHSRGSGRTVGKVDAARASQFPLAFKGEFGGWVAASMAFLVLVTLVAPAEGVDQLVAPETSEGTFLISWLIDSGPQQSNRLYLHETRSGTPVTRHEVTGTNRKILTRDPGVYSFSLELCRFDPEVNRDFCHPRGNTVTVTVAAASQSSSNTLTAPALDEGFYTVRWTTDRASPWRIYLRENSGGASWSRRDVTGTNSMLFEKPPGIYSYRLESCRENAEAGNVVCTPESGDVSVVVSTLVGLPDVPGGFGSSETSASGTYTLQWSQPPGGASAYSLEERVGKDGPWGNVQSSNAVSATLTRSSGSYYYRVRACNANGCGGFAGLKLVSVVIAPSTPGGLGPDSTRGTTFTLTWSPASGTITAYQLNEQGPAPDPLTVYEIPTTSKTFVDKPEGDYIYQVRACNDQGQCSPFTSPTRITVRLPSNITGPSNSTGVFTLGWERPPGCGVYGSCFTEVRERAVGSPWTRILREPGTIVSTTVFKLCETCEKTFEYQLRFCRRSDPGLDDVCLSWGHPHSVLVDHPPNVELTTATVPVCSPDQRSDWDAIVGTQEGVAGQDPVGHWIGYYGAEKFGGRDNWFPLDAYKQTFCGRVHHYDVYELGNELDFNHFVLPNPAFRFILDDASPLLDQVNDCVSQNDCVEIEITPDDGFESNPWFDVESTSFVNDHICAYGPWVEEEAHGYRPEIHPAEQLWLNEGRDYLLFLLQDDSNRFDRATDYADFDGPGDAPYSWRPWSEYPRTGEFRVAFENSLAAAPLSYEVFQPAKRNVVTAGVPRLLGDADDGRDHSLFYNGHPILAIGERQDRDDDIGVTITDVCRDAADTRLQGYLTFKTMIGAGDRGDEGFEVLLLRQVGGNQLVITEPAGTPGPVPTGGGGGRGPHGHRQMFATQFHPEESDDRARVTVLKDSIRPAPSGGHGLVIDAEVLLPSGMGRQAANKGTAWVAALLIEGRRTDLAVTSGANGRVRLSGVPVGSIGQLEIQRNSEERIRIRWPGIVPYLEFINASPRLTTEVPSSWGDLANVVGARLATVPPALRLVSARVWEVSASAQYAPIRQGKPSPEDESDLADAVNDLLVRVAKADDAMAPGNPDMFRITWTFSATDLVSGANVAVKVGKPENSDSIFVEHLVSPKSWPRFRITFPSTANGRMYEVVAKAEVVGTLGGKAASFERTVSNLFVASDQRSELVGNVISLVALDAGLSSREVETLTDLSRTVDPRSAQRPRYVRARVLALRARRMAADERISVGELRALRRLALRVIEAKQ